MKKQLLGLCLALMCLLAAPFQASGSVILSPVAVTENTMGEAAPGDLQNAINQNGLSTPFVSGVTDFDAYLATNPTHTFVYFGFEWFSAFGVTSGRLGFDLGANYTIDRLALWNEEVDGMHSFGLYASTTNDFSSASFLGNFIPPDNPLGSDYTADVFGFTSLTARYVWLTPVQTGQVTWGTAIGELAFSVSDPAVAPEPASILLMGMGVAGVVIRRTRQHRA